MIKLAVFDLDGTLAGIGKPISDKSIELLKKIADKNIRIAISSGKTVFYLIGMFRQVGLKDVIFIGENGSVIAFDTALPPKLTYCGDYGAFYGVRDKILKDLSEKFGGSFWLQPNEVMLTLFFRDEKARQSLKTYFENNEFEGVNVYSHADSFDVVPINVDKKTALQKLSACLNVSGDEMVAVGDGVNDLPMFQYCKYSIGIGAIDKKLTSFHYENIDEALKKIIEMG